MTSSRRSSWKSMSTSGISLRSIFRKRSNIMPCSRGSRGVMPRQCRTMLEAALPRTQKGQFYLRQVQPPELHLQVAHSGNALGVFQRLRDILIKLRHFLRAPEIEKVAGHLHAFFVVNRRVGADA